MFYQLEFLMSSTYNYNREKWQKDKIHGDKK